MKLITTTTTMPLRTSGSMISSRMRSDEAPSILAESGSSGEIIWKTARMMKMEMAMLAAT